MIEHTVAQIEAANRLFQNKDYRLINFAVGPRNILYYILPQELNTDLPDFICRFTNQESQKYVIGVCSSVPSTLQGYFALSEYIEFLELGIKTQGRVELAEKETLRYLTNQTLQQEYISRKIKLYETELHLDKEQPEKYLLGEEGREEFEKAIGFLKACKIISPFP